MNDVRIVKATWNSQLLRSATGNGIHANEQCVIAIAQQSVAVDIRTDTFVVDSEGWFSGLESWRMKCQLFEAVRVSGHC